MSVRAEVVEWTRRTQAGVEQRVDVVLWTEGRGGAVKVLHEASVDARVQAREIAEGEQPGDPLRAAGEQVREALRLLGVVVADRPGEREE